MGMSFGLGLSQSPCLLMAVVCDYCGNSVSAHQQGCPAGAYERAQEALRNIPCPLCKKGYVEVNESDFYECRECHGQFTTALMDETWPETRLWDHQANWPIKVLVMPDKGQGKFPVLDNLERVRLQLQLARRRRKKTK